MELIHEERRVDRRYDIELELRFKVVARSRAAMRGAGRTTNMSSGGVLFKSDEFVPEGAFIELTIAWPVLLQNTCPLTLLVLGRTVRSNDNGIAVKTTRYEFLTRPVRQRETTEGSTGHSYIA